MTREHGPIILPSLKSSPTAPHCCPSPGPSDMEPSRPPSNPSHPQEAAALMPKAPQDPPERPPLTPRVLGLWLLEQNPAASAKATTGELCYDFQRKWKSPLYCFLNEPCNFPLSTPSPRSVFCVCVCVCVCHREGENSLLSSMQHAARLG